MTRPAALLKALRPKQWLKNGLLLAALIFSRHSFDPPMVAQALLGALVFCVLSSCGYLYNDLRDIEADRLHPTKKNRPLASGALPPSWAWAFIVVVGPATLISTFALRPSFGWVCLVYLAITFSYTLIFKHIVIMDVMGIAGGFIVRAVAGAVVIDVPSSPWFMLCTGFGALFIAICKRYAELLLLLESAPGHRKNLQDYSPELLQQMLGVATSSTVLSYALYTVESGHTQMLMLTLPFVVFGIFRYQFLVLKKGEGGAPEQTFLRDRPLQLTVLLYVISAMSALHLG